MHPPYRNSSLPISQRVADLLSRMTLDEKIGQLSFSIGWNMYRRQGEAVSITEQFEALLQQGRIGGLWGLQRADPWTKVTLQSGLLPRQAAEVVNLLQQRVVEGTRLGIPLLLAEECAHGHMAIGATVFPTALGQASTWNTALIEEMASAIAAETRSAGATIGYGPVLDLAREPRWSRVEETFGEDTVLCRQMGVAMVRGFCGAGLASARALLPTLKHFAGHGVPEGGHNAGVVNVGPRELHAALLPPFQAAINAGAGSVMSAYNEIDGIPCSADESLLTELLRNQWKFDGFVVSDLDAIPSLHTGQQVAADLPTTAALAMNAGVDADLGGHAFADPLLKAVEQKLVSLETIDRAVSRVLAAKFKLGLFENPFAQPAQAEKLNRCQSHRELSRTVARQSLILLKNDGNLLPLDRGIGSIAVVGPNADSVYNQLGDYTAPQPDEAVISVVEGIRNAVCPGTTVHYARGCGIRDRSTAGFRQALDAVSASQLTVMVLGGSSARDFNTLFETTGAAKPSLTADGADMDSGEGFDRASLDLAGVQLELLQAVVASGKPVVLVLIQGRPLNLNWASEHVPSIICAWYPGEQGGAAIADVLFGDVNPAGRLPISIPRSVGQLPVYYNAKTGSRRDYTDLTASPLYSFGHGLSYTTFIYERPLIELHETDEAIRISISIAIQNDGPRDGGEVVQLYLHQLYSSVTTPVKSLKAFKHAAIKSGQKQLVSFELHTSDLVILNRHMQWVVEPGEYRLMIGSSSDDIRQTERVNISREVRANRPSFFSLGTPEKD